MAYENHLFYLRKCVEVSKRAREHGNTPFGAILVGPDGEILLEQENIEITESNCTGHAETTLMEAASKKYSKDFLWDCTLYSTAEPCAMCAGAIYWGNVGHLVYGITEKKLLELTGDDDQNPTFNLPCRIVFDAGQKDIEVIGPIEDDELAAEIIAVHEGFWN